ncbi:RNA polymerase sigma factor [Sinanaerobacter chloroacetimidivorans]|uniref:RNA polymerase sigma factor n=1 Tax=Sinanaerobacter chloroacetimidivorans TaxID=2818044 RepID=A0A8J8B313_9FIRM|nr:RNA polymerase sigma factor [Sinanaerobacter chloroacetimidivorans]MBR0600398.1 RNA polymerase sigma factor [Sinanaerobacter chloroacetimidivorans]
MEEIRNKELLGKIAQGEEQAFIVLYEETRKDIFAFALSILKNYHDAEDVMQEVFMKVKLQAGVCKDFENINGWLIRVTKNTALDLIRKKKKQVIDEELAKDSIHAKEESTIADYSIFISELFNELKDEERQIVVLHLISDLTHKTIAKTLGLPLTTVKWRYRKAILQLEKISKKKEWEL